MQHLINHSPGEAGNFAFTLIAHPLDASSEDRDTLVATSLGFLHDLNNLLGPIIAYASLARRETAVETAAHRYLGQILIAAERAKVLSERVLQRMRTSADPPQCVVVADLVQEVASWLRTEHPRLEVEIESPLSTAGLVGDALGLSQMVLNLCKNAVEALPPEGGKIWIAVREIESPHELRLTVRDNGHGMDETVLGRIFDPFFSTKAGGTGLGLSIAREMVRRHRGTMTIESAPGAGTSFHVRLPMDS
jgi:signal transduction histidine kinase